jgi:acyl-CoA thioesterase FadM
MIEPTEQIIGTRPFVVKRRVRWGECDPAGVAYTGNFPHYLLSAVTLFHEFLYGDEPARFRQQLDIETPCKSLTLTFDRALWPNEFFEMHVRVGDIRNSSYDIHVQGMLADGMSVFKGVFSPICIARSERRSIPIPKEWRSILETAKQLQ